ncbi:MAG: site-specific integrase [Firmicutes bacterium]|nr:site-specific integrase [Bacillota bacterium]
MVKWGGPRPKGPKVATNKFESWKEVLEKFLFFKQTCGSAPKTLLDYKKTITQFFSRTGANHNDSNDLKEKALEYLSAFDNSYTFNLRKTYLKAFFNWLIQEEVLETNPLNGVKNRKLEDEIHYLSEDQIRELLKAPNKREYSGFRDYVIMLVMLDCGIRPSEALSILPRHFNPTDCTIYIPASISKTRRDRVVPISTKTSLELRSLLRVRPSTWGEDKPIFCSWDGKKRLETSWEHDFKKYTTKAKLSKETRSYDLRHTFAIMFLRNGGELLALKRMLGHTTFAMTERYARLLAEDIQREHKTASPVMKILADQNRERLTKIKRRNSQS